MHPALVVGSQPRLARSSVMVAGLENWRLESPKVAIGLSSPEDQIWRLYVIRGCKVAVSTMFGLGLMYVPGFAVELIDF